MTTLLALVLLAARAPAVKVVAGGPNDLMVVRHVGLRGTNEELGNQLAQIGIRNHGVKGDDAPKSIKERLAWFKSAYPEVLERAKGARQALGARPGLDATTISYDMDFQPGCSVVYYPGSSVTNGHAMLSRNYDFPKGDRKS